MGTYGPTTDDMVGYGIGACFVDNLGAGIIDGDCTVLSEKSEHRKHAYFPGCNDPAQN